MMKITFAQAVWNSHRHAGGEGSQRLALSQEPAAPPIQAAGLPTPRAQARGQVTLMAAGPDCTLETPLCLEQCQTHSRSSVITG